MRTLYWFVVAKSKMSQKAKLSIYRSIYNPTLTYGHELWVVTEKNEIVDTSRRKVAGLSLGDRVRSSDILEELGVESLLLCVNEDPAEVVRASGQDASWASPWGGVSGMSDWEEPLGRRRTQWRAYISRLFWKRLGVSQERWRMWVGRGGSGPRC